MAKAALAFFKSDYAVSSTGVAGPTSPYEGIPIGRVVLGVSGPNRTITKTYNLTLDREVNIEIATTYMTNLLRLELEKDLAGK
jgi:nicotinamide-nucleotide amidase